MFQKQVNMEQALGVSGKISRQNPVVSVPRIVEGNDIKMGSFAFIGTDPERQVKGLDATAKSILGFVVSNYQAGTSLEPTNTIFEGDEVQILLKGYVFAVASNKSKYGDKVFVNPKTGVIKTSSNATETDFIDTGFLVETSGGANEVIEIYKI